MRCKRSCINGRRPIPVVVSMISPIWCMTRPSWSWPGIKCEATRVHEPPVSMGSLRDLSGLGRRGCWRGCEVISKLAGSFRSGCGRRRSRRRRARSDVSGSRRSPHRARSSPPSPVSDSVVVTHPFHPLVGQRVAVILERRRVGAELVLVCEDGAAGRVTVPVGWTDRAPAPLAHRLACEGLVELAELVVALEHPPVASRDRP